MASGWDPNIINGFSSNNQNSQPYNQNSFLQDNSFSGGYRGSNDAGHMQHFPIFIYNIQQVIMLQTKHAKTILF